MISLKNFCSIFFFMAFTWDCNAALFLEPWLGFSTGTGKATTTPSSTQTGFTSSSSGTEAGVRLGAKAGWLWLAIDPNYFSGSTQINYSNSTSSQNLNTTQSSIYGLMGLDLPARLRVYAGGSLISELKTQNVSMQTYNLNGYKLGLGLRLTHHLSTLVEYRTEKVTKAEDSSTGSIDVAANYTVNERARGSLAFAYQF